MKLVVRWPNEYIFSFEGASFFLKGKKSFVSYNLMLSNESCQRSHFQGYVELIFNTRIYFEVFTRVQSGFSSLAIGCAVWTDTLTVLVQEPALITDDAVITMVIYKRR